MDTFGTHAHKVRAALDALGYDWISFDDLVRVSALPRRTLSELIDALGDDIERDGPALRLRPGPGYDHRGPVGPSATPPPELLAGIREHIGQVPPPLPALDHVQATPETVVARARWLDEHYDLRQARLVLLGDHDLTALALHALRPEADVTVLDVDDRVLEHIDRRSDGGVHTVHADLRFGLPFAVAGRADLVFSDPPYTPEGMHLFASRALECLQRPDHGRILLAYGYSDRHPTLGQQVQRALLGLGLAFEAILPGFHRYSGAQAIGSAADLYVCVPTARARTKSKNKQPIYTHGPRSVESAPTPEPLRAALVEIAAEAGGEVEERTVDWTKPSTGGEGVTVALDLSGDPGPWLLRALLATNAERVVLLLPNAHPDLADARGQQALTDLLAPKYRLRLRRSTPDDTHAVVVAEAVAGTGTGSDEAGPGESRTRERSAPESMSRDVWVRAHARLRNVLPEAPADVADLRLIDLPRHKLERLRHRGPPNPG